MIKSVTAINHLGESTKIELSEAIPAHGLWITNITGIGPGDAIINSSAYATNDGAEDNSARLDVRTIQLTILLSDDDDHMTIEKARHNCYRIFQTKKKVRLIFETDERTVYIDGKVEHNVPDIFSKNESMSVDIKCSDPYFYKYTNGVVEDSQDLLAINPAFHFTYDETVDDGELETPFEVGVYQSNAGGLIANVYYDGDLEVGFTGKIYFAADLQGDIVLTRYGTDEYLRIYKDKLETLLNEPISAGDELIFSTDPKHIYAKAIKNGIETNILNAVDLDGSTWIILYPGDNTLNYVITEGNDNTQLTLYYKTAYQGV